MPTASYGQRRWLYFELHGKCRSWPHVQSTIHLTSQAGRELQAERMMRHGFKIIRQSNSVITEQSLFGLV
jgi:hypothetical protein